MRERHDLRMVVRLTESKAPIRALLELVGRKARPAENVLQWWSRRGIIPCHHWRCVTNSAHLHAMWWLLQPPNVQGAHLIGSASTTLSHGACESDAKLLCGTQFGL